MSPSSFLKRLIRSVVHPSDRTRAEHKARKAIVVCRALVSERGEVSGAALAREALAAIEQLPAPALEAFFDMLVSEFSPDPQQVAAAAQAYREQPTQDNLIRLQHVVEPPRQELFRRLNMAPGGTAALVQMRRRILVEFKTHPEWRGIDADLAHLFSSWFNRGFLTLARVDWHTPAIVLEKLIRYEAVHEIQGWRDLHRRLEADRRCFAFFHPALPDEPLIFIEVALTRGIAAAVQPLLELNSPILDPQTADSAIFYSITNCQDGLRGVSFGNLLIKQVVGELQREFPRIKRFATLSPVPGLCRWLGSVADELASSQAGANALEALKQLQNPDWFKRGETAEQVKTWLMPLCAYYLAHATQEGEPIDAVARFHLGNGARMEHLDWLADVSKAGMRRSAGIMVNYLYRLDDVETNHEAYVREHRVAASSQIRKLVRECPLYTSSRQRTS